MSDTDPLAGTTIGPDGRRVPVEEAKSEDAAAVTDATAPVTDVPEDELLDVEIEPAEAAAEDLGYGTVTDAVNTGAPIENAAADAAEEERAESGSDADAQHGGDAADAPAVEGAPVDAPPTEGA